MIIVALRTDNPLAELYLYFDGEVVGQELWQAHRELSATIHKKLHHLLASKHKSFNELEGIIFYKGPGSFTGLRIGISVVNALGAGLNIPVTATIGSDWQQDGMKQLAGKNSFKAVEPFYGADATTSAPKK